MKIARVDVFVLGFPFKSVVRARRRRRRRPRRAVAPRARQADDRGRRGRLGRGDADAALDLRDHRDDRQHVAPLPRAGGDRHPGLEPRRLAPRDGARDHARRDDRLAAREVGDRRRRSRRWWPRARRAGATSSSAAAGARTFDLTWMVSVQQPADAERLVAEGLDAGYTMFDAKIGMHGEAGDLDLVPRARRAAGDRFVQVDANRGYRVDAALRQARRFEDLDIALFEQPLNGFNLSGYPAPAAHEPGADRHRRDRCARCPTCSSTCAPTRSAWRSRRCSATAGSGTARASSASRPRPRASSCRCPG